MTKLVLDNVVGGFNLNKINSNFQKIEDELQNKVLYRDNPVGEPNGMITNLDMNGKRVLNLPAPISPNEPARLSDLTDAILPDLAVGDGSSLVGFTQAESGAILSDVQTELRREYYTSQFNSVANAVTAATGKRLVVVPGQTITLNVPSQFSTIQSAFSAIQNWIIHGTVIIQVADGTYDLSSGINLNHLYGDKIQLLGNTTTPDNCILRGPNPPTFDAITCTNGNRFGLLNGFMVDLSVKATLVNNYTAVLANNGATIICGTKMKTNNWYYGIAARNGSFILADSAVVNNAGDVGIWSFVGSSVQARNAVSNNASDVANGFGFGFQAEYGSSMDCSGSSASGCNIAGIAALSGGTVRALSCVASSNVGSGFLSRDGGTIENHSAVANNNTRYGEERIADGMIRGSGVTLTGNTLAASNGYAYLDNSGSLGARLAGNGDLRLDVNNANQIYFNTSGGPQTQIGHTAGSVNYPLLTGSSTTNVSYSASGTGTDVDVSFRGKGNGFVFLGNNRQNYVRVNAQNSGTAPQLRAEGVDTDIDLLIGGKGTGLVRFGTYTSGGDVASNGYITIRDAAGNTRKLMTTA